MNLVLRQAITRQTFKICDGIRNKTALRAPLITSTNIFRRDYCDERVETRRLPQLMDFPPIVWPSILNFVKNWMFSNFIIRPYFEQEFSLYEFIEGSKHAVQVILLLNIFLHSVLHGTYVFIVTM